MMKTREENLAEFKRLQSIYPSVRETLMAIPGVVQVGIGIKETQGVMGSQVVFRVYVENKVAPGAVPAGDMIPPVIQGVSTDVIQHQVVTDEEDTSKYRPVKGGIQIGLDGGDSLGTLGCLVTRVSDGKTHILSNHHVLYDGSATDGTEVGQPEYVNSCCCSCGDIAVNVKGIRSGHLDCAIAKVKDGIGVSKAIEGIGNITGVNNAVPGEAVKKRGRTTELTTGNVSNLVMSADGTKILEVEVKKNNGNDRFSRPGDSGSALLNNANEIIGLHKAGNNGEEVVAGNFISVSVGIQEVLDAFSAAGFQITIQTGSGADEVLMKSKLRPAKAPESNDELLFELEKRLEQTTAGREILQLVHMHRKEMLQLINQNRNVTVVWRRKQGPAYVGAVLRSLKEPAFRIPDEIEGVTLTSCLLNTAAALEEQGSNSLRNAIHKHLPAVLKTIDQFRSTEDFIRHVETGAVDVFVVEIL